MTMIEKKRVQLKHSVRVWGWKCCSFRSVQILFSIAGRNVSLKTDVVKSEITLLLSKQSMKTAKSKIEFVNDGINMSGKNNH